MSQHVKRKLQALVPSLWHLCMLQIFSFHLTIWFMEDFLDKSRSNSISCPSNMLKRRKDLTPRGALSRQAECAASTQTLTFSITSWYRKRPTNCQAQISWVVDKAKWVHRAEYLPCLKKEGLIQIQMMPQPPLMRAYRSSPIYFKLWPLVKEVLMENKIHKLPLPTLWVKFKVVKHRSWCASNHKKAL